MTEFLTGAARAILVFGALMSLVPVLVLAERRIAAAIQDRIGPNRVGPQGLLQPLADILKLLFKEDVTPRQADKVLFALGPFLAFAPAALAFAVIPVGRGIQVVSMSVAVLFAITLTSLGVYGISFGGWASNSKYSLLGALRSSAQIISYEIAMALALVSVLMTAGSVDLQEIVARQGNLFHWHIFRQPLAFLIFTVSGFAENNRLPFDLAECEAELVGGYHTEYSSIKFALFMMGEYVGMILMSSLLVTFFLGGWYFPGITNPADHSFLGGVLSVAVFVAKIMAILTFYVVIRWTLPRFKYNQLMNLGWKRLVPLALANVLMVAVVGVLTAPGGGK